MNFAMHFLRCFAYPFDFAHASSLVNNTIIEQPLPETDNRREQKDWSPKYTKHHIQFISCNRYLTKTKNIAKTCCNSFPKYNVCYSSCVYPLINFPTINFLLLKVKKSFKSYQLLTTYIKYAVLRSLNNFQIGPPPPTKHTEE